mgnify:CR=1 FL=1
MSQAPMPLFPLATVLYPQGVLNLQIFEVRYLDLMKKCLRDNTPFGVVSLLDGNEVRRPDEQIQLALSRIHISEPTRRTPISYAVFCLKKYVGCFVAFFG